MSRADAAKGGGVARQSLRDRVHRFNEAGPEGLFDRRVPRPQMRMRPRWLNLLRSSKPTQDPGLMEAFKKRPPKPCLPFEPQSGRQAGRGPGSGRARIGQKTGRVRIRARKGTRPRWPAGQRYKSACLSGAVCADRETGAALMLPCCHSIMGGHWNKEPASQGDQPGRCKRRSGRRPDGPRAGAHIRRGEGPETLTLIFLPARSPELNRVGKVWQSLRENGLSNRLLEDQADGLAAGCDVWTRLMKEPTAIESGASREWTQNGQT